MDQKKKELEKILEDDNNMINKTDRKLAQQLLDPTTPYALELVNCMKSKDPEGALNVYKEMKHRQIQLRPFLHGLEDLLIEVNLMIIKN